MRIALALAARVALGLASLALTAGPGAHGGQGGAYTDPGKLKPRKADCLLEVNGKRYIDGWCDFASVPVYLGNPEGSFMIQERRSDRITGYFAYVFIDTDGSADGSWSAARGAKRADAHLGTLTRNGACWQNETARVCAWKPGEPRGPMPKLGARRLGPASLRNLTRA